MFKRMIITIIVLIICLYITMISSGEKKNYGYPFHLALNNSGDKLYVAFPKLNKISELDSTSLEEIRCFDVVSPDFIILSSVNDYLFTATVLEANWPQSYFIRIDLTNGEKREISLNGQSMGFTIDDNNQWLWVAHRTFPVPGESYDPTYIWHEAWKNHVDSGHLTRINAQSFTIDKTINTTIFPMSVSFSKFSNQVLVLHEWEVSSDINDQPGPWGKNSGIVIDAYSIDLLESYKWMIGGKHEQLFNFPTLGCNWSDDGRFYVVPSSAPQRSLFSLRVFDTYNNNNSIAFDISILTQDNDEPLNINFIKKVPNTNILWGVSQWGVPPTYINRPRTAIKINTETREYELYAINEATSPVGYFDVSGDGRTLYITLPKEGSILKCHPDNLPPICNLVQVTDFLNPVIFPFPVEFDTPGTYDPNGDALTYEWDFDGDGIFDEPFDDVYGGSPNNPTHVYTDDFDGVVSVRVRDPYDGECTAHVQLTIFDPPPDI